MRYGLVIDMGATNLRIAITNEKHEIVEKRKCNYDKTKDIAFTIYHEYKKMKNEYPLESIVVAIAGTIDFKKNIVRDIPNINIKNYNLYSALHKLFKLPITIINDASLAAIGEYYARKNEKCLQYITISSGIGGGLVYNGKLYEGHNGFEQEIGRFELNGDTFENLCSGNALRNRLLKAGIDEEHASDALLSNKENYKKVVNEWLDDLSKGVANLVYINNPSVIVIGGGLGLYLDYYKDGLLERLTNKLPKDIMKDLKIEKSYYLDDSALIGGSYLIFQDK